MTLNQAKQRLLDKLADEVVDRRVLSAMAKVPRERFVADSDVYASYEDTALGIGAGQTISQPTIVAIMVQELDLRRYDRVLEIGTGSGYQAAVLAELAREVVTVERIASLADSARKLLDHLGYRNVRVEPAGEVLGLPDEPPFNAIIVAAAAPKLPRRLVDQLEPGGRLIVPVGARTEQNLMKITKTPQGIVTRTLGACRFVPLIGEDAWSESELG